MSAKQRRAGGKVTDDRGVERRVVSIREMWKDPRMNDPHFAAMVERAVRFQLTGRRTWLMVVVGIGCGILASVGAIVLVRSAGVRMNPGVMGGVSGMIPAVVMVISLMQAERARAAEIARAYMSHGVCPGCAYTLGGLPTESDGCIACPECGAAWKADRIARRPAFTAPARGGMPRWIRGFLDGTGTGSVVTNDDAGQSVPLASGRLRPEIRAAAGERLKVLRDAEREMARHGQAYRAALLVLLGTIAAALPPAAYFTLPRPLGVLGALLPAAVMGLLAIAMFRGSTGIGPKVIRREMLARGLCPSCSIELTTAADPDTGLTTCAECGAHWRRAGVERPPR